jgi:cell division protein FtsN
MQTKPRFAVPVLVAALLVSFNFSAAQQTPQGDSQRPTPSNGVTIDPSAGPLKPSETMPSEAPLPNAPQPVPAPATAPTQQSQTPVQPAQEPLGTAAAGQIRTAGGAASRPAGNAIAPAKQHQYRSLLIKLGAVAAAGVAVGTVYGLSRATPSTPPHSASAAAAK